MAAPSAASGQTATGATPATASAPSQNRVSIHIRFHEASRARLSGLPPLKGSKQPRDGTVSRNIPVAGSTQLAKVFRAFARDQELQDPENWQMMFQPMSTTNLGANRIITTLTIKIGQLNVKQNDHFALIHKDDAGGFPTFPPQRAPAIISSQPLPAPAAPASTSASDITVPQLEKRNDAPQATESSTGASQSIVSSQAKPPLEVAQPLQGEVAAPAASEASVPNAAELLQKGPSQESTALAQENRAAPVAQGALPTDGPIDRQGEAAPAVPTESIHADTTEAAVDPPAPPMVPTQAAAQQVNGVPSAPVAESADGRLNAVTEPSETQALAAVEPEVPVAASAPAVLRSESATEAAKESEGLHTSDAVIASTAGRTGPSGIPSLPEVPKETGLAPPADADVGPEQSSEHQEPPFHGPAADVAGADIRTKHVEPVAAAPVISSTESGGDGQAERENEPTTTAVEEPPRETGQSNAAKLQQDQSNEMPQPSVSIHHGASIAAQVEAAPEPTNAAASAGDSSSVATSKAAQPQAQQSDDMDIDDSINLQSQPTTARINAGQIAVVQSQDGGPNSTEVSLARQSPKAESSAVEQPPSVGQGSIPADDDIDRMFEDVLQSNVTTGAASNTWIQTLSDLGNAAPANLFAAPAAASSMVGQALSHHLGANSDVRQGARTVDETGKTSSGKAALPGTGLSVMSMSTNGVPSADDLPDGTNLHKSTGGSHTNVAREQNAASGTDAQVKGSTSSLGSSNGQADSSSGHTSSGASGFTNIIQRYKQQRSAAVTSSTTSDATTVRNQQQADQSSAPTTPSATRAAQSHGSSLQRPESQAHLGADNFFAEQMDLDADVNDSREISVKSTPTSAQDKRAAAPSSGSVSSASRSGISDAVPRAGPASKTVGFKARPRSKGGEGAAPRIQMEARTQNDATSTQSAGQSNQRVSSTLPGTAATADRHSSVSVPNPAAVAPEMDVAALIKVKKEYLAQNEAEDSLLLAARNVMESGSRSTRYDEPAPPAGSQARLLHNPADLLPRRAPSRTVSPEPRAPEGAAHVKHYRNPRKYWEGEDELGRRSRSPIEPLRHPPEVRKQMTASERQLNDLIDGPIDRLPEEGPQARPRPRYTEDWSSGSGEDTDEGDSADEATLRKREQILAAKGLGPHAKRRKKKNRSHDSRPRDAARHGNEVSNTSHPAGSDHTTGGDNGTSFHSAVSTKSQDLAKMDKEKRAEARAAQEIEDIINRHEYLKLHPSENKKARVGLRKALYDECPRIPKELIDWREDYALKSVEDLDEHVCALLGGNMWRQENKIADRYHFHAHQSHAKLGRIIVLIEICLFTRADLANELWRLGKGGGRKNVGVPPGDWPIVLAHVVSKVMKFRKNIELTMRDLDDAIAEAVALKRREILDGEVDEELQAKLAISSSQAIKVSPPKATTLQQPPTPPGGWRNMPKNRPVSGQSSTPTPAAKRSGSASRRSESAARSHSPAHSNRSRSQGAKPQVSGGSLNHNAELKRKRSGIKDPQEEDEDSEMGTDEERPLARQRVTGGGTSTATKKAPSAKAKRAASPVNGESSNAAMVDLRRSGSSSTNPALLQEVDELVDEKLDNSFARRFEEQFSSAFGEAWRGAHALGFKEMFPKAAHDYWQSRHKEILASSRLQQRAEYRNEFEALLQKQEERLTAMWEQRLDERDAEWKERFDAQQQALEAQQQALEAQLASHVADQDRKQLARDKYTRKVLKEQMLMELGQELRSQLRSTGMQSSSGQASSSNEAILESLAQEQTEPAIRDESETGVPSKGPKSRKMQGPGPASKRKQPETAAETSATKEMLRVGDVGTPSPRAQSHVRERSSSSEAIAKAGSRFSHIEVLVRHKPPRDAVVQQSSDEENDDEDDEAQSDDGQDLAEKLNGGHSSDGIHRPQDDASRLRSAASSIISTIGDDNGQTLAAVSAAVERTFGSAAGGSESEEAADRGREEEIEEPLAAVEDEEMLDEAQTRVRQVSEAF
ncbi:hypothetical protein OC846_002825 [Tilletia horrida]|uniref:Uncharacterized protein n=1 Tax=Tilletia horrida TaxID=155126 RepID=A0AAN6JYI9_9BASI|nr:hypothetical protein OC846_002825 [Tilletia horrida]